MAVLLKIMKFGRSKSIFYVKKRLNSTKYFLFIEDIKQRLGNWGANQDAT